jgi:CRP-like cAMP-binding protein
VDATEHFLRIPLFSDLNQDEILDVLRIARVVTFAAGEMICKRGERADCAFVIEQGTAEVTGENERGKQLVIARVGAGEVVGELALIDGQPRSADVMAKTDVRGYRIDRSELDALRRALHPAAFKITRRIAITISDRLRDVNDAIAKQLTRDGTLRDDAGRTSRAAQRVSRDQQRGSVAGIAAARTSMAAAKPATQPAAKPATRPAAKSAAKPAASEPKAAGSFWRSMVERLGGRGA